MKELNFFSPMRKAQAKINKLPVRGWRVEVWDSAGPVTSAESVSLCPARAEAVTGSSGTNERGCTENVAS